MRAEREPSGLPRLPKTLIFTLATALRLGALGALGCARASTVPTGAADGQAAGDAQVEPVDKAMALDGGAAAKTQIDEDGNDDPEDPGSGSAPARGRWEKVGTPPLALTRICDLTPFGGALYAAHANQPLGTDGATITRYRPGDEKRPFTVAFDWNRPGEPTKGGGAGQGFLRVHAIGGRLFVADADPPYAGLALVDGGAEGYVFVSDGKGAFAPARQPNFRPPQTAGVLPRAYHVLDVVRFRGATYASTGSVPPKERAWRGPSPGALHRASDGFLETNGARWTYEVDYPYPYKDGVWRLTFLVRFKDRLYAGIQDYDMKEPNDYVYFAPPATSGDAGKTVLQREDAHPTRVTRTGGSQTLRWWADTRARPARLYWLAWTRDGVELRVTTDGDRWSVIALPDDAGRPTDVTRFRDAVVVLTEWGLYRLSGAAIDGPAAGPDDGVADANATLIASVQQDKPARGKPKTPFEVSDYFCTSPLAVMDNVLYAGGQRGGSLYRLAEGDENAPR